ncbi:MAG: GNAT family N-acetyltransferase [Phycisphaerales bacterium]
MMDKAHAFTVGLIDPAETHTLRQRVLRPYLTVHEVAMEHDVLPSTFHVGAKVCVDHTGIDEVVAIMTVMRDPLPGSESGAWRIRGMASSPEMRGKGSAGVVLKFGIKHAWSIKHETIWCNARRVAYGFYERFGFELIGDEFDIPGIGPHKVMTIHPPSL